MGAFEPDTTSFVLSHFKSSNAERICLLQTVATVNIMIDFSYFIYHSNRRSSVQDDKLSSKQGCPFAGTRWKSNSKDMTA